MYSNPCPPGWGVAEEGHLCKKQQSPLQMQWDTKLGKFQGKIMQSSRCWVPWLGMTELLPVGGLLWKETAECSEGELCVLACGCGSLTWGLCSAAPTATGAGYVVGLEGTCCPSPAFFFCWCNSCRVLFSLLSPSPVP